MTDSFYTTLRSYDDFLVITDPAAFTPVPDDWHVALSDVVASTAAIARGEYKAVNLLGASTIVALLNLAAGRDLPFVFGGDGAIVLVPPSLVAGGRRALLATRRLAREQFGLELRVGLIPVADLYAQDHTLGVVKLRVSPHYAQALFGGDGLLRAEALLKAPGAAYRLEDDGGEAEADFDGLECRWQDIPSHHGETVVLLVVATTGDDGRDRRVLRDVWQQLLACYGEETDFRPIEESALRPAFGRAALRYETRVRGGEGVPRQRRYLASIWLKNLLLALALRFDLTIAGVRWRDYVDTLVSTTDYKKFDGLLRLVAAGTPEQRAALARYLDQGYRDGDLAYGLHVTDRALLTCLVFERMGHQVHFVDGADGGYARAARGSKQRLAARERGMGS